MFLRKGVVWKNYDRESVLYDLENDSTLTLNETSTRILKEVLVYKNEYQKVAMNLLIENQECEYDDLYGDVMECCNTLFATPYFTTDPENAAFISLVGLVTSLETASIEITKNCNLEAQAEAIYNEMIANNSTNGTMSTLGEISTIKTGKLNSEAAVINGIYPFFTCSQETYRTNTFSFDQEAVLLAGNNASAIYPLKIYCGKFDVYQRTYVISSNNRFVSNKQLYFVLKQQLNEFKGISSGTTTKFLTMKILTPIPVVIAPEDIATSFINITNKIFETIFQNQREIEHLRELQMIVLGELSRD